MSTGRPKGDAPDWASNELYVGVGLDTDETKLAPSVGEIENGHVPETRPPPEWENWWKNRVGAHQRHVDLLGFTFPEPTLADTFAIIDTLTALSLNTVTTVTGEMTYAGYDPEGHLVWVGGSGIVESFDGGYTWTATVDVAGHLYKGVTCKRDTGTVVAILEEGGAGKFSTVGTADMIWSVTATALTSATVVSVVVPDEFHNCFWIGGNVAADPRVWRLEDTLGTGPMTQTAVTISSGTFPVSSIAAGPDWKLAGIVTSPTASSEIWRWEDGDAAAVSAPGPSDASREIVELHWLPEDELFLLVYIGTLHTTVYTSPAGATGTWTLKATLLDTIWQAHSMCVRGSEICGMVERDGRMVFGYSKDAGATWSYLPDPNARWIGVSPVPIVRLVGNRLVALTYVGSNEVRYVLGHRVGPMP